MERYAIMSDEGEKNDEKDKKVFDLCLLSFGDNFYCGFNRFFTYLHELCPVISSHSPRIFLRIHRRKT